MWFKASRYFNSVKKITIRPVRDFTHGIYEHLLFIFETNYKLSIFKT